MWWTHLTTVALCTATLLANGAAVCSSILSALGIAIARRHETAEGVPARAFYDKVGASALCSLLGVLLLLFTTLVIVADRCARYVDLVAGHVYVLYVILGACAVSFCIYVTMFWAWIYTGNTSVNHYVQIQEKHTPPPHPRPLDGDGEGEL